MMVTVTTTAHSENANIIFIQLTYLVVKLYILFMHVCFCSAQRLHALQLELTAVQLLREQLEESIKTNEELRDDLERELHRAKQLGEGAVQTHKVMNDNGN